MYAKRRCARINRSFCLVIIILTISRGLSMALRKWSYFGQFSTVFQTKKPCISTSPAMRSMYAKQQCAHINRSFCLVIIILTISRGLSMALRKWSYFGQFSTVFQTKKICVSTSPAMRSMFAKRWCASINRSFCLVIIILTISRVLSMALQKWLSRSFFDSFPKKKKNPVSPHHQQWDRCMRNGGF